MCVNITSSHGLLQYILNALWFNVNYPLIMCDLQVETIQLYKAENTSLGFSVVGLRSEHRGELGIFVQDIQASGVAAQ